MTAAVAEPTGAPAAIAVTERDVIAGVRPRLAFAPDSVAACAEVMAAAARDRLRLGFVGGGTALGLGAAPAGLDAVVRTERMARIVEHAPADIVVIAEAGLTLGALQVAVGAHRQRLALDAPWPDRATVGGIVATGAFGPLRARYGTVRDLIIGVTLVGAGGEIARGGGKVVKNVAGFDLPKVACGSLGTLGMIAVAAFRLHPQPEAVATVVAAGLRAEAVVAVVAAARHAQLEPACVVALGTGDPGDDGDPAGPRLKLALGFEGFGRGVDDQVARMLVAARAAGAAAELLNPAAAAAFWHRHDAVRAASPLRVRVAALPTQLPAIAPLLGRLGRVAWYATLGLGFAGSARAAAAGDAGSHATTITALTAARAALVAGGGSLVVEDAPDAVRAAIDPWGPVPPGFSIMARLKQRFDPDRRLNPGRFVGGL